jgi:hypothetical protein
MYDLTDPRSTMTTAKADAAKPPITAYSGAEVIEFHRVPPQETGEGYRTWYGRGQNFVLSYTEAEAGAVLSRGGQPDEYMAFFPDRTTRVDIESHNGSATDVAYQLAIIPPGDSRIMVKEGGRILRLFSSRAPDLAVQSFNAASYEQPHPNVATLEPWPTPPDGFKLRLYPIEVAATPGRFGVIYRSTNLMINLIPVAMVPRDPDKMSPHAHDDFEQCSLTLQGDYTHYLRWPWVPNKSIWRDDAAIRVAAPSMTVIPPLAIHTSQSLPEPPCQLVDIFSPPRIDFSEKPGWVLNADDYPMP